MLSSWNPRIISLGNSNSGIRISKYASEARNSLLEVLYGPIDIKEKVKRSLAETQELDSIQFSKEVIQDALQRKKQSSIKLYSALAVAAMAVLGFFIVYLWDYVVGLIKYRDGKKAYSQIRLEQEAYMHHRKKNYLENRKHYAWLKYKATKNTAGF